MTRLIGQKALITGAANPGGIGEAIALALAAEGADVALADLPRLGAQAQALAERIRAMGRQAAVTLGDVTQVADCQRHVSETIAGLGGLNLLVNNAGGGNDVPFLDSEEADYHIKIDVNVKGAFFVAQAAARHMLDHGGGKIINVSSELNYIGEATAVPYTMAKGAIRTMTKSMALALAPDILVNTVAPGPTASDAFLASDENTAEFRESLPLHRFADPVEIGRTVVFLASDDGNCFTGQTLDPNVGAVMA